MSEFGAVNLSRRFKEMDFTPRFDGYSGVEIYTDKDADPFFSGDYTGRILTIQNPWGTQEQADNLIEKLRGYQYQPYQITGALLDPAAELGDGINARAFYSGIHKIDREYGSLLATDVAAPQDEEVDHEYPFEPQSERDITRRFASVESELSIQSDKIGAAVTQRGHNETNSFAWELLATGFTLYADGQEVFKVDDTGAHVTGIITATSGEIGGFSIGSNAIYNNIDSYANPGGLTSGVYLGTDGIRLGNNFSVSTTGAVTATQLTVDTLYIGGNAVSAATLNNRANSAYSSTSAGGFCYTGADKALGAFNDNNLVTYMKSKYLTCTGTYMTLNGTTAKWKSATLIKSVNFSNQSTTQETIFYLGN